MKEDYIKCISCASKIDKEAKVCPHCSTYQRRTQRILYKTISTFSAASVVLGVITIAISLFPQAYDSLFYHESLDIFTIKPRVTNGRGVITFVNTGIGDLYINEVQFEVANKEKYPIKSKNIIVNRWVKKSEVLSYTFIRKEKPFWSYITPSGFEKRYEKYKDQYREKYINCFMLEIIDSEFNDEGVASSLNNISVISKIFYSSSSSRGMKTIVAEKNLSAKIRFFEKCDQYF